MTLKDLVGFLCGREQAIRALADNRLLCATGAVLVLTAAAARNYDQTSLLEKPWWPLGPFVVSLVSSFIIYLFVNSRCPIRPPGQTEKEAGDRMDFGSRYLLFLGFFWMTAPLAWLYGLPFERWFSSSAAAYGNGSVLLLVSLWRVLLLPRCWSVVTGAPYGKVLGAVLLPAGGEMLLFVLVGGLSVLDVMGGLRHSPERQVAGTFLGVAFWGSLLAMVAGLALLVHFRDASASHFPPRPGRRSVPWPILIPMLVFWTAVSIDPQRELARTLHARQLVADRDYKGLIAYVSSWNEDDFAPSLRLPPDPYQYGVFTHLPGVFDAMDGTEPEWVRRVYLGHLEVMLGHWRTPNEDYLGLTNALARFPEGDAWQQEHGERLRDLLNRSAPR